VVITNVGSTKEDYPLVTKAESPEGAMPTLKDDMQAIQGQWKSATQGAFAAFIVKGTQFGYEAKVENVRVKVEVGMTFELKELDRKRYIEVVEFLQPVPKGTLPPYSPPGLVPRFEYRLQGDSLTLIFPEGDLKGVHPFARQ
jgi:hypothetical protein